MKLSLRSWIWRVPVHEEVDEEIAFHVEMRTRELVAGGMEPRAARELAIARLGDLARLKRTCVDLGRKRDREMRLLQWLEELRDDVRFAVRQLRAAPLFSLIAALTLALGIGANSAMFALVDATLLRPLPFPQADRLVIVWERSESTLRGRSSPLNLLDWDRQSRTFDGMAGFIPGMGGGMVTTGADGLAETIPRQWVTAKFFDVLGVKPILGRTFVPADDRPRANAIVISEGLWRRRFAGNPNVIGQSIRLDGNPYTIIGVVPRDFQLLGPSSMWGLIPSSLRPAARGPRFFQVVGRLKAGVSIEAAGADMTAVAEGLAREYPSFNQGRGVLLEPLRTVLIGGELRRTSMLFLGVVGLVLLMCCANVANLVLARATARARELSVRSALGAGRRRIVRQLLTESLVLAAIGGTLGAMLGAAILKAAPLVLPQGLLPGAVTLSFDMRVVAFCAAAALGVGLLFGLAPAWQAGDVSSAGALNSRGATGTRALRSLLVAGEVAMAVVLLVGAGLLLRTLIAVDHVDRGYRAETALTMVVDPLGSQFPTAQSLQQFFDDVEREIRALPGVRDVAWTTTLPMGLSQAGQYFFEIVGDPPRDESRRPSADFQLVSAPYFRTLELPIVAGRGFTSLDTRQTTPVCIVNEAFVRRFLQGRSPIGVRLSIRSSLTQASPLVKEIVGVARSVKGRPDETDDLLQIYAPITQLIMDDTFLVVRPVSGRAEALAPSVRAAIGRIDKEQLVSVRSVTTLEDVAWEATARHRFRAVMVMTFAALALLLAAVGVFGMLAYSVQQRGRELGVRMALGASAGDVLRLVVGSAVRVMAAGTAIGLALAAVLGRLLTTMLFGVQPLDPATFVGVTLIASIAAVLAAAGPAWRATRTDPAVALRAE